MTAIEMCHNAHPDQEGSGTFDITVEIRQADDTSESATMVDLSAWVVYNGQRIANCQGNLIKREMMRDPEMFPYLMEITQELEEVAKDYGIFHPNLDGTMTSKAAVGYFEYHSLFREVDYKVYREENKDVKEHPCNRAWILYFNSFTVDERFRRQHIGRSLVRAVLKAALQKAIAAGRPLLAGVRPGFLETNSGGEAESVRFWKAMGFVRHPSNAQPDVFFWGVPKGLPVDRVAGASTNP